MRRESVDSAGGEKFNKLMKLERKVVSDDVLEGTDILPTFNINETNKTAETKASPSKLF